MLKRLILSLIVLVLFLQSGSVQPVTAAPPPNAPQAPAEFATYLIPEASEYTAVDPLLYFFRQRPCFPFPNTYFETFERSRVSWWEPRAVYHHGDSCDFNLLSNMVADDTHIYYVSNSGLSRVPVDAAPNAVAQVITAGYGDYSPAQELVITPGYVYGLSYRSPYDFTTLWYYQKGDWGTGAITNFLNTHATNLQTDGDYLYLIFGPDRTLRRISLANWNNTLDIANGVSQYVATGEQVSCQNLPCTTTRFVYYVPDAGTTIVRYDELTAASETIYTAAPPEGMNARIYNLADGIVSEFLIGYRNVWFFEKQWTPCLCAVTTSSDYLHRMTSAGGSNDIVYSNPDSDTNWITRRMARAGSSMLWQEDWLVTDPAGTVRRLPLDADALAVKNLAAVNLFITQGIQNPGNSERLVQQRPTYVLFGVKAPGGSVRDVTARLTAGYNGNLDHTILPTTRFKTVEPNFNPSDLNHYFIFELPAELTNQNDLQIKAEVNPFGYPLEPSYTDNWISLSDLDFAPPAGIDLTVIEVSYYWNGVLKTAGDTDAIVSWLLRAFPLSFAPGYFTPADIQILTLMDNGLGVRINNYLTAPECAYLNGKPDDEKSLCASDYLNDRLMAMKNANNLPTDRYVYATVANMPRGSAGGNAVANGPELSPDWTFEYRGAYAGHEIGHMLGRPHPVAMASVCGHSASDPGFPYFFGRIGDSTEVNFGFDSRLGVPGGTFRRFDWESMFDLMTYCSFPEQWPSDYTYQAMYDYLIAHPSPAAANLSRPALGDYLQAFGRIDETTGAAGFTYLSRETALVNLATGPALSGAFTYALRFLDAGSALLSEIPLAVAPVEDAPGWLAFQATPLFPAGTASIQIVRSAALRPAAGQAVHTDVLHTLLVSANPPTVADVALQAPPDPLAGVVALTWTASDADGDPLTFDLLYSVDGGLSFDPLQLGLADPTADVDFAALPGGSLVFRVVASDGVNTAFADSPAYPAPLKPPQVSILNPSDGVHIQYGQTLNLMGVAVDPQDWPLTSPLTLTWSNQWGVLGSGEGLTVNDLPVGMNLLSFTAANSSALESTATITVYVGDDLQSPPPVPSVAPTTVNFQVASGETALQTTGLLLSNTGGEDSLAWTAGVNAPWVSLDLSAGVVPGSILVTVDPAGLQPNSTNQAVITITVAGSAPFTPVVFHIPVLVQVGAGELWGPAALEALFNIFLPALNR